MQNLSLVTLQEPDIPPYMARGRNYGDLVRNAAIIRQIEKDLSRTTAQHAEADRERQKHEKAKKEEAANRMILLLVLLEIQQAQQQARLADLQAEMNALANKMHRDLTDSSERLRSSNRAIPIRTKAGTIVVSAALLEAMPEVLERLDLELN